MKSIEWFMEAILTWIFLLTIYECYGFRIRNSLTPYERWLESKQYIQDQDYKHLFSNSVMHKRGCKGFPCMYTHMGGSAGNASIKKAKLRALRECIADPFCSSIGKRSGNLDREFRIKKYLMLGKFINCQQLHSGFYLFEL